MERYCPKCFNTFDGGETTCPDDGATLVGSDDRDLVGELLDNRYRIRGLVGKGGMGVVYHAEQEIIGRHVALKVLRRDIVRDTSQVKRFLTEAKAIASLTSLHTVTLYDFGVTSDGLLYYTMELLDGRSLGEIIDQDGPLPYPRAIELILQACDSLAEAHDSGILHRDIKPENIFVSQDRSGEDLVKVLDFGIAKLMGDQSMGTLTQTGMICGTPAYLSPEQALGNPAGKFSDLYSLAITLYEVLAGKPPFVADTPMKLLLKHLNDEPPALTETNPQITVPGTLDGFLRKALAKEPENRYGTVNAFRSGLEEALRLHEEAPTTRHIPQLQASAQGTRTIAITDEAGTVDLATAKTALQPTPRRQTETASPPISRRTIPWVLGLAAAALVAGGLAIWQPWAVEHAANATDASISHEAARQSTPTPKPAPVAAPAAEKAPNEAEFEARVQEAEDAARRRLDAEAAQRAAAAAARSKVEQETLRKAVKEAATKAADEARRKVEAVAATKAASEAAARDAAEEAARVAAEKKAEDEARRKQREAKKEAEARKKIEAKKAGDKKPPGDDDFVTIPTDPTPKKDPDPADDGFVTLPE